MSFNLFEEIMYFTNRNEPDIIYLDGEFVPNPFKKFDEETLRELFRKADTMNRR